MAKPTDTEKQAKKEMKLLKHQEQIEMITQKKENKLYENAKELNMDLNLRLKIALRTGTDPLGQLSITQIYEDIQTVNKLKDMDLYGVD